MKTSTEKWATEPALEVGRLAASPSAKISGWGTVALRDVLQGVLVDGDVVELVAQPGPLDEVGAHVERHRHEQVVGTSRSS